MRDDVLIAGQTSTGVSSSLWDEQMRLVNSERRRGNEATSSVFIKRPGYERDINDGKAAQTRSGDRTTYHRFRRTLYQSHGVSDGRMCSSALEPAKTGGNVVLSRFSCPR